MKLQCGDIILVSKNSIIAKFINIFQNDPCIWGHVMLVKDENTAWEAYWTLRETDIHKRLMKTKHYKIIRNKNLIQMFDHFFGTNWFTSKANSKYLQVCSSYVAWVYWCACKYKFNNVPWMSCDPDDIEDDQLKHPERWEVLLKNGSA